MNKKLKISLLIVVGVVVIGVGSVGYKYYPLIKNVTSNPSDAEISDEEEIENPFDNIGDMGATGSVDGENQEGQIDGSIEGTEADKDGQGNDKINGKSNKGSKEKTEQQKKIEEQSKDPQYVSIVEPYKQRFQNLQEKQEGQLNSLVEQGKSELAQAKQNGKSPASLMPKYASEAVKLENRSQSEFNSLKSELQSDLKGHSYDPAIVNEVEGYYKQRKNSMQSEILGKIKGS